MEAMDVPQISRSGRVLKKSAKVKEMEDFDINEIDLQGKARKKPRMDDSDEYDDKRVAPIKIPKISLNIPSTNKKKVEMQHSMTKLPFQNQMKTKQDMKRPMYRDSSPDGSKESDSSSVSSETSSSSSSSSEDSDCDVPDMRQRYVNVDGKSNLLQNMQHLPSQQEKVIVKSYQPFDSPVAFVDHNNEMPPDSEDEVSDSALVIAEESNDSLAFGGRKQTMMAGLKKKPLRTDPSYAPKRGIAPKKRMPTQKARTTKPTKPAGKSKPLTAYMLWCSENRKRIASTMGNIGFGNIGKKMGEAWQALPDKEKMAWRRKAKRLALKNSGGLISTGPTNGSSPKGTARSVSSSGDEISSRSMSESSGSLGTAAIDAAAYLKLLGDSLSVIGQRLTEHEGQLAVSGIFSVLLDTILCVVGPLLCLTSESPVLNSCPPETFAKTLDSIAYFMPGL
ncbi:HMG domain-containing protein 4-like [Uloborus diversus]|uniref:HMG domain-containing protein 4-like n=1 Tax=Uloborus diversus TaxID=327109 RepID=UPI002409D0CF|nr:HMG domain-containing protein 4-like [Uloborus diversus]